MITEDIVSGKYSREELTDALRPISSIISKCEKAQQKFKSGTTHHKRFQKIIHAMEASKALIKEEISGKN